MLHAFSSYALKPLLPLSDSSVSVRPALRSRLRSVSRSLPRYHHVEMPMPTPKSPIVVFSCQKQPASLTTTFVNSALPAALFTSASATAPQSAARKTAAGVDGPAGVGCDDPHPTSAPTITTSVVLPRRS